MLKETVTSLRKALETSSSLIARLESDLEGKMSAFEAAAGKINNRTGGNGGSMELAELLGVADDSVAPSPAPGATDSAGSSSQMVNILQTQRDRYKDRLTQADANLLKLQQRVEATEASKAALEADNLALYGKIRFLQSYGGAGGSGNPSRNYVSPKVRI